MSHTPGPWWYALHDVEQRYDVGQGDRALFRTVLPPGESYRGETLYDATHISSNARLIAAAPDLLHFLKNVATDAQLDARMSNGKTGREILMTIEGIRGAP